jgi:hypothetical protein
VLLLYYEVKQFLCIRSTIWFHSWAGSRFNVDASKKVFEHCRHYAGHHILSSYSFKPKTQESKVKKRFLFKRKYDFSSAMLKMSFEWCLYMINTTKVIENTVCVISYMYYYNYLY